MSNVLNAGIDVAGYGVRTGVKTVGGVQSWLAGQWSQRLVQVSVFSAVVFWFLGSYKLINQVDAMLVKTFSLKLGHDGTRALHAVIFGFFMYSLSRFILDPLVVQISSKRLVEGRTEHKGADHPSGAGKANK